MSTSKMKDLTRMAAALAVSGTCAAGLAATADASTIVSRDCNVVAANSSCATPDSSYGGNRCGLFRLDNGSGVSHSVVLFDVRGSGTQMDVYTPRVNVGSSIAARGYNNSASGHQYHVYQVTC